MTDQDRERARRYITGTLSTQAELGCRTDLPAGLIEQAVEKVARHAAELRHLLETRGTHPHRPGAR